MEINLIPDTSVSSAPAGFTAAVEAAAKIFDQDFPGDYKINIRYGWGTWNNQLYSSLTNQNSGDFAIGGPVGGATVSYATAKGWLSAAATSSNQIAAVASLPASYTALPNDANSYYIADAEEIALGQFTGSSSAVAGAIGFNTGDTSDSYYWETAAFAEIGHALGWMTDYYTNEPTILDLFRYSSAGQRQWTGGQSAFFSINGGTTDLANFSTSFDYTLFTNVAANDPFNVAGDTTPAQALTSLDIEVLNVLGFSVTPIDANTNNFNGGVTSDVLLESAAGTTVDWVVSNGAITAGNDLGTNPGWSPIGTGDFNGDGTSDILMQNGSGTIVDWTMLNGTVSNAAVLGNSVGFNIVGTGDFTGNGTDDILLQNSVGTIVDWIVNNGAIAAGNNLGTNPGWNVVSTGDFNGDGTSDLLLENSAGTVVDWTMGNGTVASAAVIGNAGSYDIVGTGDFTGNGTADILLQHTGGDLVDWIMSNGAITSSHDLGVNPGWTIAATGDYTGNGVSDILLTNAAGSVVDWTMSNGIVSNGALIGNSAGFTVKH